MKTQTKMSFSILSVLFFVSMAFAGMAPKKQLTEEQTKAISETYQACRQIKAWPRAESSDDDYCSCVQWHLAELAPRTQKLDVKLVTPIYKAAADTKKDLNDLIGTIKGEHTMDFTGRIHFICTEDVTTKYSFPL